MIRKILITHCDFPETHMMHSCFPAITKPRFEQYAFKHGFEFNIVKNSDAPAGFNLGFAKVHWVKEAMKDLQNGDVITYMDCDCVIVDGREPAIFDKDFSIVMESTGCLCMGGTWSVRVSGWSRTFFYELCSVERNEANKGNGSWDVWHENDAIYHVLGLNWGQSYSDIGTRENCPFTKDNLKRHVQFLPTKWGVTFNPDDNITRDFAALKTIRECYRPDLYVPVDQTIVRHLSAGSFWEPFANDYFNKPMILE